MVDRKFASSDSDNASQTGDDFRKELAVWLATMSMLALAYTGVRKKRETVENE
jgi:hypothetical protein